MRVVPAIVAVVLISGCSQPSPQADCRTQSAGVVDRDKALVRRWFDEGFNQHNVAIVDELFVEHVLVNGRAVGRDGIRQSMSRHFAGFPDLHVTIDDIVAEECKVSVWYTVEGTHGGEFEGIPATNRRVKWTGVDFFSVDGGRIADARFLSDLHGLLTQLGSGAGRK
jgi:steroid delta-isomerase-like uncharacterized protein